MGYLKIPNLYKDSRVLQTGEKVYALEKVHGTSAHLSYLKHRHPDICFFAGGCSHQVFVSLFSEDILKSFRIQCDLQFPDKHVTIYGEAYGGKIQKHSHVYGKEIQFVAFDVRVEKDWLDVPSAALFCAECGIKFVSWVVSSTDLKELEVYRDRNSDIGQENGCEPQQGEGIVIRPIVEQYFGTNRAIAKFKTEKFSETKGPRTPGVAPEVLSDAQKIAEEWVTTMRLEHLLGKESKEWEISDTPFVCSQMIEDILLEAKGEIVESKEVKKVIGRRTMVLYKEWLKQVQEYLQNGGEI